MGLTFSTVLLRGGDNPCSFETEFLLLPAELPTMGKPESGGAPNSGSSSSKGAGGSKESTRYSVAKEYGGTHNFMNSYGIKPYDTNGYQEANSILDAFVAADRQDAGPSK